MKQKIITAEEQFDKMTKTPVSKLIAKLAVPTVISMLVTSIYNMADTFFVSQINTQASAAVGVVFPIMAIIQAFGFTLGMGSGSLVSVKLGEKRNSEANEIASVAFAASIFLGAIVTIFGNVFSATLLSFIGATESVLPYAQDYARYIFWGAPFICASFVLNNVLRSEGKAFLSMIALTFGSVLNIFLDPFFIYVLKFGISGAAVATLISQAVGFLILLSFYLRRKTVVKISVKNINLKEGVLLKIICTGIPSLARQGLASVASILLNTSAAVYGDAAIAAMSIASKILMFVASVMIGIGQGFSPVSGYNYGAKFYDRVKKSYWFMIFSGSSLMTVFAALFFIFAEKILGAFINDETAIEIGATALRWQVAFMPFHPLIVGTNMLMQSTRHIKSATFLSMNRQGIFFIPAILILPRVLGLTGVEISQFAADVLSSVSSIPFLIYFFGKLNKLEKENKSEKENSTAKKN